MRRCLSLYLFLLAGACGGGDDQEPLFPEDYAATYQEVRDCRGSGDHDFRMIRILADPAAFEPYMGRVSPFPEGAVVLKEEYETGDDACAGELVQWTVMVRGAEGSDARNLDWTWQTVDAGRSVVNHNDARCASCHSTCVEPEGYVSTCSMEDGGGT